MDVMDIFFILLGAATILLVVAIFVCGAYRLGYSTGMAFERLRREAIEARQRDTAPAHEWTWEGELDV